ncbi:MAG: 3'-5' exonuclease [Eubacteriales bacterium]|nr:3'-5' exonuclease [Eubacteriales bacterium]
MNYIVFDLEWNQCPDGKQREKRDIPFEILEIGAIKLNSEKKEIGRFHEYIKPTVYRRLHSHTREIIHISQARLRSADTFPAVIERFHNWCGSDVHYCIWGSLDLLELQRNIRHHKIPNFFPFPLKYYDIQKIFSLTFEDGKTRRTLEYAVDFLGIKKDIPFHEALSDAYYTAAVMQRLEDDRLLPFFSIDYFRIPSSRNEEIFTVFETYAKYVSRKFRTKSEAMHDRTVRSAKCYLCGENTLPVTPWFPSGSKNYLSLSHCPRHGYLKGKIRLKKAEDGRGYFCVKTLKLVNETIAADIQNQYEKKKDSDKAAPPSDS